MGGEAMRDPRVLKVFAAVLPLLLLVVEASISAEPPKTQTTSAGRVEQVFVQTSSDAIGVGGWGPPDTAVLAGMTVDLASPAF